MTRKTMKSLKNTTLAALALAMSAALPGTALAISDAAECQNEVKSVVRDLLKASVSAEDLGRIDAAIIAAEADCVSGNFSDAEAKITAAREMISNASNN